jgi:GPH family glycoside/pentoside/hexuronide:cation symporter
MSRLLVPEFRTLHQTPRAAIVPAILVIALVLGAGCSSPVPSPAFTTPAVPAASPSVTSAALSIPGTPILHGLCFSPYKDGQSPGSPAQLESSQIQDRLGIVAPYATWIRTYGCDSGLERIPVLARSLRKNTSVGVWLGGNAAADQRQIDTLVGLAREGYVDVAVVGNEAVYGEHLTTAQLITYLHSVRSQVPARVNVTTAEPLSTWQKNPGLVAGVDEVYVNLYPFWNGVAIEDAVGNIESEYTAVSRLAGGRPVVIAETGWPTAGNPNGAAVASPEHAERYFREFSEWAEMNDVRYFYFEAFDENWKGSRPQDVERHWGLWDSGGTLKFPLT